MSVTPTAATTAIEIAANSRARSEFTAMCCWTPGELNLYGWTALYPAPLIVPDQVGRSSLWRSWRRTSTVRVPPA
jgi:hypothetical protein